MSLEIKVPPVGESITEVTIAEWLKNDGEYVEMDEAIAELESDKATFELNAEGAGVLKTKAKAGDTISVGDIIGEIDDSGKQGASQAGEAEKQSAGNQEAPRESNDSASSGTQPASAPASGQSAGTGSLVDLKIPAVGESITEVTLSSWYKKEGDFVEEDEVLAEIESDKATFELNASATGSLHIIAEEGATLEVGQLACQIEVAEAAPQEKSASSAQEGSSAPASDSTEESKSFAYGHPSPVAKKILEEKGIDPSQVKGTGPGGRITKEDAEKASPASLRDNGQPKAPPQPEKAAPKEESKSQSQPVEGEGNRQSRREKMSSLRKTVSKRLVSVKNETAMLTTFNEVNMKPVMDLRKKYKDAFKEKYEVNLGFMSFFTKAACMALKEWPAVNAQIDGDEIIYNDYCDVSIAVSGPKGLVVPVIRNAESMSFDQIEKEVVRLATRVRDNKISIEEMSGGTFTITNGGVFGSLLSTPIINSPQSAILGMHKIEERAVVVDGEIVVRPMMYLALSYDHRIIDGRESVSFLVRIKELIEDPSRLLLGI